MKKFLCKKELAELDKLRKSNKRLKIALAVATGAAALASVLAIHSRRKKN